VVVRDGCIVLKYYNLNKELDLFAYIVIEL
jgi:hypothetical protein